jgi:hypothetical protein
MGPRIARVKFGEGDSLTQLLVKVGDDYTRLRSLQYPAMVGDFRDMAESERRLFNTAIFFQNYPETGTLNEKASSVQPFERVNSENVSLVFLK